MQTSRLEAYCQMRGLTLARIVREEGVSASKPLADRPGGAAVMRAIATRQAAHIVALKLDRLFRDAADALLRIREWDHSGVALHLVDMGGAAVDTASAMGRMMLTILAGFAEWERNVIAERTAAVLAHKKKNREVYGTTPLGFQRDGDQLVEDATELEVIQRMRALRREGLSLRAIADRLNAEAVPTKQGARWYHTTVRYLLRNPLYGSSSS